MANNMDANLEFLAGQIQDLEREKEELLKRGEEAEELIAQAQEDASAKQKLLEEAALIKQEMEAKARELEKRYVEVSSKLEAAQKAEDYKYNKEAYRLAQKQKEHLQKEVKLAKAEVKQVQAKSEEEKAALSREIAAAREEVEKSGLEMRELMTKVDVYTHVFNNIVFPKLATRFAMLSNETANDVNGVKLRRAVDKAKSFDKRYDIAKERYEKEKAKGKQVVAPQKNESAYTTLMTNILDEYNDFLNEFSKTPSGKELVGQYRQKLASKVGVKKGDLATPQQEIEQILKEQSKSNVKEFFISTKVGRAVLATTASLILIGATLTGIFLPGYINEKGAKENIEVMSGIVQVMESDTSVIETSYDSILETETNASRLSGIFEAGGEEVFAHFASKNNKEVDKNEMTEGHKAVQEARVNAEDFIKYDNNGKIADDCHYAMLVNEFNQAKADMNIAKAEETKGLITDLKDQLVSYKNDASKGYSSMLDGAGVSMGEISVIVDILKAPTSSVEFTKEDIKEYNSKLANAGKGGYAVGVVSNEYVKNTGEVNILVECVGRNRKPYFNLINYKMEKNVSVLTTSQMMDGLVPGQISATAFDKDLVTNMEGQSSEMSNEKGETVSGATSIKYSCVSRYDEKSKTTTITASALVAIRDDDGKVVGTKIVNKSKSYFGKMTVAESEDDMKALLAKEIGNQLGMDVTLEAEDVSELN